MTRLRNISKRIAASQGVLPFDGGRGGLFAYALPWERHLIRGFVAGSALLAVLYVFFVTSSILHVAARQDLMGKVVAAKNAVSSLETEYFQKEKGITEQYAGSLGYVAVADQSFVNGDTALTLHDTH